MIRLAVLALAMTLAAAAVGHAKPHGATPCHRTRWRYIEGERVPWDHDTCDHDSDEFEHSVDECIPPPC